MISASLREQHAALTQGSGFAELADRTQIEVTGKDRAQLLHGLCTNNIKTLQAGDGCEAFFTNLQGRTIGFAYIFCTPDSLVVDSSPGITEQLIRNLDRYVIREDVRFTDRRKDWLEILWSGPAALRSARDIFAVDAPAQPLGNVQTEWRGGQVRLRRVPFTGADCLVLAVDRSIAEELIAEFVAQKATHCDADAVEVARIEAGTPIFGQDVTDENLPQEVDRNAAAISFTKGCYLGQETVARLDALGHVNRTLCGVKLPGSEVPVPGTEIQSDGKSVGRVTSACWSVRCNAPLSLAYVRRGFNQAGTRIPTPSGIAEVVSLPLR